MSTSLRRREPRVPLADSTSHRRLVLLHLELPSTEEGGQQEGLTSACQNQRERLCVRRRYVRRMLRFAGQTTWPPPRHGRRYEEGTTACCRHMFGVVRAGNACVLCGQTSSATPPPLRPFCVRARKAVSRRSVQWVDVGCGRRLPPLLQDKNARILARKGELGEAMRGRGEGMHL